MYTYSLFESIMLVLYFSGRSLLELAPYAIIGVIVSEILKLTSWTKLMYKATSKSPHLSVIIASVIGMVSPLCTYGTVPVVLQLYKAGINISPLITFLSVSTMMNPQLFILTWGGLGYEIALIRTFTVLLFGILLGLGLYRIPLRWVVNPGIAIPNNSHKEIHNKSPKKSNLRCFVKEVMGGIQFVGFYLVIGVLLSSIIDVFLPKELLTGLFQGNAFLSLLISALLGIPLYACGGGVIPLVRAFISNGMGKGEVLAFLFVGPATRITPLIALAAVLRPLFIVIYVLIVITFAFIIGVVFI